MKKRLLETLVVLCFIVGLLPSVVMAEEGDETTTLYWYVEDEDSDTTCEVLYIMPVSSSGAQETTDVGKGWATADNKKNITKIVVGSEGNKVSPMKTSEWFNNFNKVTSMDLTYLDMSNVTSAFSMFNGCESLETLDVSNWDVSKNRSFGYMFMGCKKLKELDVSNWNTENATSFNQTFKYCNALSALDLSNWKTPLLSNMNEMLFNTSVQVYDLRSFTIANATNTTKLFHDFNVNSINEMNRVFIFGEGNQQSYDLGKYTACRVEKEGYQRVSTIPAGAGVYSKKDPVTIVYNPNGGTGESFSEYKVDILPFSLAESPFIAPENKSFVCWNTNSDGTGTPYFANQSVDSLGKYGETISLYAIWTEKVDQSISYENTTVEKHINSGTFTNELTQTTVDGEITYISSNTDVATVNETTGEVTIVGTGTATITATVAETDIHKKAVAEYTLTVTDHSFTDYVFNNDATCTVDGTKTAKCDFCDVTDTVTDEGTKTEHDWTKTTYAWSGDGKSCTATHVCLNDNSHTETVQATITSEQTKDPNYTEMGETTYTATFDVDWASQQTKTVVDVPAIGTGNDNDKLSDLNKKTPQTSDTSNMWLWFALLAISVVGVGTLVITKKRNYYTKHTK